MGVLGGSLAEIQRLQAAALAAQSGNTQIASTLLGGTTPPMPRQESTSPTENKETDSSQSNIMLYAGIGAAVLVLIIILILVFK
jgi:hypothetical protein